MKYAAFEEFEIFNIFFTFFIAIDNNYYLIMRVLSTVTRFKQRQTCDAKQPIR